MPPLPDAPGVLEVRASYLQGQQVLQNVFHVHRNGVWSPTNIANVLQAYVDWEEADGKDWRSNTVALAEVRGTDLSSHEGNYASRDVSPAIFGDRASQALPENVTVAVQAGTGKRGRGKQGRVFWIGLTEDMTDGSRLTGAAATGIVDALNTLKSLLNAIEGGTMVILNRTLNGADLNPATFTPIGTYGLSDLTTDSQKNRLPGHKRHKRPTP